MNAGDDNRGKKKISPETLGKGQKTLSSFFNVNVSKCSSDSIKNSESKNDSVKFFQTHSKSTTRNEELGKKRKFSPSKGDTSSNDRKAKKMSVVNPDTNIVNNSVGFKDRTKHNTVEIKTTNIVNNQCDDQDLCHKLYSDLLSASDDKLSSKSVDDTILFEAIKKKKDSLKKETQNKLKKKLSSVKNSSKLNHGRVISPEAVRSTKKCSPLKMDSRNVQKTLINREDDSFQMILLSDEESNVEDKNGEMVNKTPNKMVTKKSSGTSKSESKNSSGRITENRNSSGKTEDFGFGDDDDFLFDAFDEPFKADDNKRDKAWKESGHNSESCCDTLTDDFDDAFNDDWNGDLQVNVDLNKLQRCKVLNTSRDQSHNLIVEVIHIESQTPVTVTFMGFWREARLEPGDFINIQAVQRSDVWIVDNSNGFVVEQPDFLVSGTSVVGALFCARRGVLSDRFKGIESVIDCKQGSSVMVIGNLVHELLQEVLKKKVYTKPGITKLLNDVLNSQNTANMLYSASMSMESCRKDMFPFVPKIFHFIERYVKGKTLCSTDDNFNGNISTVHDIEENLWVPQLGVKGKVDVTVEVNVDSKSRIMPLELKTGRASFSLEHRGQVILYTMMMAVTGQDVETGLLLYLRENIMREIKVGHPERRDLIILRNNLAYYLTRKPEIPSQLDSGSVSKSKIQTMELPEPINHRACQNCPYTALCCTYLKDEDYKLSERHPLTPIMQDLNNYLKPEHIEYVKRWVKMLQIDEVDQVNAVQPLKFIWTVPPMQREKKGKCVSNLKIIGTVTEKLGRYEHTFSRGDLSDCELINDFTKSGFNSMDYVIVSTNTRFNVCAGPIIELSKNSITLLLERNLLQKRPNEIFHIDGYVSQSLLVMNLSNIGYLLDNNTITERMRKIVIEREPATFLGKLDRSVLGIAKDILIPLNVTQQRAVLKVLTVNDYFLIKGMPGSGKTVTLVAIIELLVKMGKSVLLTAHTHSAVDNVLLKLIKKDVDFIRLGSSSKIHPLLAAKSESVLTQDCLTPESLDAVYNSKNVVCVTCLGANHPLLARRMFDVCLVDESTQVLQSSVLRPLYSASKFVLIGDPDQLPPVVKSNAARELGMDESLFERLDNANNTFVLKSQYRMNERIMSIANRVTYKGQLMVGADEIGTATLNIPDKLLLNSAQKWVRDALSTDLDDSVVVLDTGDKYNILKHDSESEKDDYHTERKCSNLCEAAVILRLANTLIKAGVIAEKIGIIAPYREQVNLLRDVIKQDIEVNTVDQYQGRDKEVIIYSGTKSASSKGDVEREFNILDDHRRLTVAITRAKHKLIIVADVNSLKQYVPFKKLFDVIRGKDLKTLQNGCADFMWKEVLSIVRTDT